MQIFILGKSKSGKTTLSQKFLAKQCAIYEAGAWARKEYSQLKNHVKETDKAYREKLTEYALSQLQKDNQYSIKQYDLFLKQCQNNIKVIVGIRNPEDFIEILKRDKDNKIIWVDHNKENQESSEFDEGLDVIEKYVSWKNKMGLSQIEVIVDVESFVKGII